MSKFKIENEKSARKMLADAVSSLGTVQRKLQALIVWGVDHAEKHGDHSFLSEVYRAAYAKNRKTGAQIETYICAALNLEKEVVTQDGETVARFARVVSEVDGKKLPLVNDRELLETPWFEYRKAANTAEFDIAALEKYLAGKVGSKKASAGVQAYAEKFLDIIKADRVKAAA